jgi:putative membrane protein
MRDQLANDRTFLAWFRTGVALVGLGVVIAKLAFILNTNGTKRSDVAWYTVVGIVSVLCGALIVIVGYLQHRRVQDLLASDVEPAVPHWPLATTACAVGGAVLVSVLLGVTNY